MRTKRSQGSEVKLRQGESEARAIGSFEQEAAIGLSRSGRCEKRDSVGRR